MLDPKALKQLIRLMTDNDLMELNLEDKDEKILIRRGSSQPQVHHVTNAPPVAVPPPAPAPTPASATPAVVEPAHAATINSPMVGSFYTSSGPDAAPFVKVGDHVTADQVVCIIEAMKVFNEIKAEVTGTIEKILVDNGQAVEFGQPLFAVRPD